MSNLVLDASAMLAVLQQEPGGTEVMAHMEAATGGVAVSTVNFCEVIGKLVRDGLPAGDIRLVMQIFREYVVEFSISHAERAGALCSETHIYGLSLADRACLALAQENGATVLTGDRIWKKLNVGVHIKLIRD